jgi:transcriptional regulator GlxA family with amidase domain
LDTAGHDTFNTIPDMRLAVLVVDGVADFGLSAVLEAFDMADALRTEMERPPAEWTIHTASLGSSVHSARGHIIPTTPLSELSGQPIDTMIIPAVNVLGAEALVDLVSDAANAPVLDQLRGARLGGVHLAAACTGTYFLAEAGVLDGSPATTSWWLGPSFRRRYPRVQLDESRILCHGNQVTTAGAVLSHLDLALSLIHRASPDLAERASRFLTMGNRTTQSQFIVPEVMARGNPLIAAFERWVREHISDQFLIATAARELGVTERSLQRAVRADLAMSPKDFADDIRLERAVYLLRTTTLTVDAIASEVGYLSGGALRALIRRRRGLSVAEIRGVRAAR